MTVFPMPEFVSENTDDFVDLASLIFLAVLGFAVTLHESIEQNNSFVLVEAVHVGVAVRRSFRALYDVEFVKRKINRGGQSLDAVFEFTLWQWRVLVEERRDHFRIQHRHTERDYYREEPNVEEEVVAAVLHDPNYTRKKWQSYYLHHSKFLQLICDKKPWRLKKQDKTKTEINTDTEQYKVEHFEVII